MEKFNTLIIGFGKAGKTLAGFLSKKVRQLLSLTALLTLLIPVP